MSSCTDTQSSRLSVPTKEAITQSFPDDYVDGQILREVLQEHYKNEEFTLKWSVDRWWLKAIPQPNNQILSKARILFISRVLVANSDREIWSGCDCECMTLQHTFFNSHIIWRCSSVVPG